MGDVASYATPRHLGRSRPVLAYIVLACIFLSGVAFLCRQTIDIVRGEKVDVAYFSTDIGSAALSYVSPDAAHAGIRPGDSLLAVNGRPYTGSKVLAEEVIRTKAGSAMRVRLRSQDARVGDYEVLLPATPGASGALKIAFDVLLNIFMPAFCLFLGSWVVLVRPRDRSSWLLLGLLLGFSHLSNTGKIPSWGPGFRELGAAYDIALASCWPIFMFLFGFFFPEPFPYWTKASRLRKSIPFIALSPLAVNAIVNVVVVIFDVNDYRTAHTIQSHFSAFQSFVRLYTFAIVSGFFAFIFMKSYTAISPDSQRRLRLLYWGTSVGMTPGLFLTIIAALKGKPVLDVFPDWVIYSALLMLLLAPLTFGYVIVVQRAMDVRVVLRQGLQYGLATRGIRILQVLIVGTMILSATVLTRGKALGDAQKIALIALGFGFVFYVRRLGDQLRAWTDRRFFREAYNAEIVLSELSDQVRGMVETRPLIETVATRLADILHVPRIAVLLGTNSVYRPAYALGYGATPDVSFASNAGTVQTLTRQREPARVYLDDPDSWLYREPQVNDHDRAQLATLDTELLLPLNAHDNLLGFISLGRKLSDEPYSGTDVRLLKSVAAQTGLALENSRLMSAIAEEVAQRERLNREVEIAREVQERLFPQKFPPIQGVEYAGACRPALGVGGDYYDFLALPGGQLGIAIGDVSGKGISAALMMASLQASLRSEATRAPEDLAAMVGNVNRLVYEASQSNRYATFFYAQYDPTSRILNYVNAGHNPPMLFRNLDGVPEIIRLEASGTVVGLLENFPYQQASLRIDPGDVFIAFTDGISEAMNQADEEWGEDELIATVQRCNGVSPADMIPRIMQAADAFVSGAKQHDDMTLVVLRAVAGQL